MQVSAVQRFTLLDYPDKTACIVFTPGCNFRCGYCHNPEFVLPEQVVKLKEAFIDVENVYTFLKQRKGRLDGVVISGGEPTLQKGLVDFLREVKNMDFLVKLDTNGSLPEVLKPLLEEGLLDYVAMDVKTSLDRYGELVGACVRPVAIQESIRLIMGQAPDYEFRTTIVHEHHDQETLLAMQEHIRGAKRYVLQGFRPGKTLDMTFDAYKRVDEQELKIIRPIFEDSVEKVLLRA